MHINPGTGVFSWTCILNCFLKDDLVSRLPTYMLLAKPSLKS